MRRPNPFALSEENVETIYGRREEIRIFTSFINAVTSKQAGAMLIIGPPGMGKSLLLRHFKYEAEKNGLLALYVKVEKGEDIEAVVNKLQQEMQTKERKMPAAQTLEQLVELIEKAGKKYFGTIIFIDDIDRMKKAEDIVSQINAVALKAKISFVMSSIREFKKEISTVALRALDEHDAKEFVAKALRDSQIKMGEECIHSILTDSQGNPKLFKSICWYIYEMLKENEKVISKGHYLAYLPAIMSMLSREWFGRIYQETPQSERDILAVLAKKGEDMHVSEVAKKLGKKLGPITALIKRLLDSGQIVKIERGRYRIFSKLYAKYVIQRA